MTTNLGARSAGSWKSRLAAILILSVALRAGMLWKFGGSLHEDRDNYRRIAEQIASGEGYIDPDAHSSTAYRPPLYPLLLAAVLFCGGDNVSIGIVQLLLGTAIVWFTILCGRRLGLNRAALVAGLLVAVDPLLLHQTVLVMTETLATFLAALLLWICLGRQTAGLKFVLGVVLGLCCLCRPTFWAFGALAVTVWMIIECGACKTAQERRPACWQSAMLMAAGMTLVIAPWGIRNAVVMGRPIITTTHGGYTLLLAHNPAYTRAVVEQPWGAVWEGESVEEWKSSIETEMARETPPIDVSHLSPAVERSRDRWMQNKACQYIREAPRIALEAGLTLLGRFWNIVPMTTKQSPLSPAMRLAIGAFYASVFLTMLVGLIRMVRSDWRSWWPLFALVASFTAVHAVYWADMRMRTPLVPVIALLAAAGVRKRGGPTDNDQFGNVRTG